MVAVRQLNTQPLNRNYTIWWWCAICSYCRHNYFDRMKDVCVCSKMKFFVHFLWLIHCCCYDYDVVVTISINVSFHLFTVANTSNIMYTCTVHFPFTRCESVYITQNDNCDVFWFEHFQIPLLHSMPQLEIENFVCSFVSHLILLIFHVFQKNTNKTHSMKNFCYFARFPRMLIIALVSI